MKINFAAIFTIATLAMAGCAGSHKHSDRTIAETTNGKVKGYMQDSVLVFKGIPYASAERFMPAHAHEKWDTVMDCTEFGAICPQSDVRGPSTYNPVDTVYYMDEDCLNLNIWTSAREDGGERPVMVWIHGGGFDYGNSHVNTTANGLKLAANDNVVLVTLNHRLNVLGHLDLSAYGPEYAGSGNLALTDIVQALKWIKENIAAFGGNPNNVTIFGHGSGGVKTLALMGMPSAKGYFHKAIIQSGTIAGMTQTSDVSRRVAELTLEEARAADVETLHHMPFDSLYNAAKRAVRRASTEFVRDQDHLVKLGPVIDGTILPASLFSDTCISISLDIPVVIGSTFSEYNTHSYLRDLGSDFNHEEIPMSEEEIDRGLEARFGDKWQAAKQAFIEAYPDRPLKEVLSIDTHVRSIVLAMAHKLSRRGNTPVFVYLFNWVSPLDNGSAMCFRSSEIPFIFNNYEDAEFSRAGGDEARRLARIMSKCWTSFARSGNPNNSITPFWRRINPGEGHTMIFGRDLQLVGYPDLPLMQLIEPKFTSKIVLYNQQPK